MYQLRFQINKFNYEIVGTYDSESLAYGMRKKLCNEQPKKYNFDKLFVKKLD